MCVYMSVSVYMSVNERVCVVPVGEVLQAGVDVLAVIIHLL